MESEQSNATTKLRQAVADHLDRYVSVTVAWNAGAAAVVSLSGRMEGLVEVPGDSSPLSLVVAGQDVTIWPQELEDAAVLSRDGSGVAFEFESGLRISIERTD